MPNIRSPIISPRELGPRQRLAAKYLAAAQIPDRRNRSGEMYEVTTGLRLFATGFFTRGDQISRKKHTNGEPDQSVKVGNCEVDGLFRRPSAGGVLVGQAKSVTKQGSDQIRDAVGYAIVDQCQSRKEKRGRIISGLLYVEPSAHEITNRKVLRTVLESLVTGRTSAASAATAADIKEVLDRSPSRGPCG